jgi:hypothetical protein
MWHRLVRLEPHPWTTNAGREGFAQDAAQAALQHDSTRPIRPQGDQEPIVQPRQSVDSFWLTLVRVVADEAARRLKAL